MPNQRYKIIARKGSPFTLMVVGESGLGKTTFVNTLFSTVLKPTKELVRTKEIERTVTIDIVRVDVEERGFNVRLSIIDTPGFGDYMNNQDCWVPIVQFLDEQHHNYMKSENGSDRRNIDDLRVHACVYFIQPSGHTLTPLDIKVMKKLGSRVNLIPVIAKADTMTPESIRVFKQRIRDCIAYNKIQVYQPSEDDEMLDNSTLESFMPFSVISSIDEVESHGKMVKGREYLWGVAEVENENHCDFSQLRNLLIRTHLHDLIQSTEAHYEEYRTNYLVSQGLTDADAAIRIPTNNAAKMKNDEETLRKRFTEQVRLEETRFRQWEQKVFL